MHRPSQHRPSQHRRLPAILALSALALTPVAAVAAPDVEYGVGAAGAGDPYFTLAGNGGIDVRHYFLDLHYTPPGPAPAPLTGQLRGTATILLDVTEPLSSFNLDLRGLTASSVTINNQPAAFRHEDGNELVVEPARPLRAGQGVRVVVEYGGTTGRPRDLEGVLYGWVTTRDGAMVASQPDGSATWFPTSDHPTDKAKFSFTITVPEGIVAVANGVPAGSQTTGGWTTWRWNAPDPMASYLATATIGNFELRRSETPSGVPVVDAVDRDLTPASLATTNASLALTGEMMTFFEEILGPYPFVSYGAIVDDDNLTYALETQTRPIFSQRASEGTAAHELIHQWIGDDVSVERWADIWHNEGWATYGTWLWNEHQGRASAQQSFDTVMARPATQSFWQLSIADPGPFNLFASAIYDRGAATFYALREKIGDDAFLELTQRWVAEHSGSHASTAEYIALAEAVSGQDLTHFFDVWLYTPAKPTSW